MTAARAPLQTDLHLWQSLRIRRRRDDPLRGLDGIAFRASSRLKHARVNLRTLKRQATRLCAEETHWAQLSDRRLNDAILEVRETFARRKETPELLRRALAAVREVAFRERGERPYPVQVMGALAMIHGQIVEMVTGEGKTLTASVAACVLGWRRRPVHVITVNDYLADRDAKLMQPVFKRCGLTAGAILEDAPPHERIHTYRLPLVYTTQKQLVADWLRDQLRLGQISDGVSTRWLLDDPRLPRTEDQVLVPGLYAAIVDELDAVLIDEAVTPLIIAQPRQEEAQAQLYQRARDLAEALTPDLHYTIDQLRRKVTLKPAGVRHVESLLTDHEHAIFRAQRRRQEMVEQALVARHCYQLGQHYQIVEDQVMIVDEYTGRFMADRQWQHGLHQAVEAKHRLEVTADRDTLASLSFQRFFRLYPHLCGMTGTAADALVELETTYGLPVRVIPTHRPIQRRALPPRIYSTQTLKWEAVIDELLDMHAQGRPVLVGTRSVEASEHIAQRLAARNLKHEVLNAVHHKEEAQIISRAGQPCAITVATNMAGRGTDIKLGPGVAKAGGLHVILTELHTARRIDRQLIGRAGRQGDPGSSRMILSLDDDLPNRYLPGPTAAAKHRFHNRVKPLPRRWLWLFKLAQRRAERRAYAARAATLRHEMQLDRVLPR